jgi:hypothetical protein
MWVALWRMFHNIQDEADGLLDESRDLVVIPDLIPVDAMKAKTAPGKHKQAHWLFHLEAVLWSRNYFFRSGSDFQKVSAPATALEPPVITDFMLKRTFFMFLMKENRPNSHVRSYSI